MSDPCRIGIVDVTGHVWQKDKNFVRKVQVGGIVLRVEHLLDRDVFRMTMEHPDFRAVEPGTELPQYTCTINKDGTVKFREVGAQ